MGLLLKAAVSLRKGLPVLIRQECISAHSCALSHTVSAFVGPAVRQAFLSVRQSLRAERLINSSPSRAERWEIIVKQRPVCHNTSMLTFAFFSAVRPRVELIMLLIWDQSCVCLSSFTPLQAAWFYFVTWKKILATVFNLTVSCMIRSKSIPGLSEVS